MVKYLENENDFKEIIKGKVLVDFYAEWCGPCRMLGPILDSIDAEILKVNVDEFANIAKEYGIMSIPTLILFENGVEIKKEIGFKTKEQIEAILK